jgi:hypothetical protein
MDLNGIDTEDLSGISTDKLKSIRIELYEDIRIPREPTPTPNLREMYLMKKYGGDKISEEVSISLGEIEIDILEVEMVLDRIDNELCEREYK